MKFFEGSRPEVYIHGAKLRRDKKTGKRLWALTLIVTLNSDLVVRCDDVINQAFIYLLTLANAAEEVLLMTTAPYMSVNFFPLADDKKPQLHLAGVDIEGLRLTRDGETVEFWFQFEIENNHTLHAFVKEFAFTRVWAEFKPRHEELERLQAEAPKVNGVVDAFMDKLKTDEGMQKDLLGGDAGIDSVTVSSPGRGSVTIERAAKAAKKK